MKKITVQGSSVKQRLMITGLVSWVIISTFYIGWKVWTGKCSQGLFLRKGVDLEWVSYTPLHLKSNPLLIPLLHKEWSVPNPIHSLPWSWVWSGVSRSEPVSVENRACEQTFNWFLFASNCKLPLESSVRSTWIPPLFIPLWKECRLNWAAKLAAQKRLLNMHAVDLLCGSDPGQNNKITRIYESLSFIFFDHQLQVCVWRLENSWHQMC